MPKKKKETFEINFPHSLVDGNTEDEPCKVYDPTTDECLDEKIQKSLQALPEDKKFRIKRKKEVLGKYEQEWYDIGGKGEILAEAMANEYNESSGRGLLGHKLEEEITYQIEQKEEELSRELTEAEKEGVAEFTGEIEAEEFEYYLRGNLPKKQQELMEEWGIQKIEVTEFYNDVYGRWMNLDEIQNVCPYCGFPLTKSDIQAGYCGRCGEGPYGTSYWHGVELHEFSKEMQAEGVSLQRIEEMLDVSGLEIYVKWKEWQAQVEEWEEERWEKEEQAMQKKLKAMLESEKKEKR